MSSLPLHWHEWGEGERIALLVHGIMTDGTSWRSFAPLLAEKGYRVLAPDLRGHGSSPRSDDYTWPIFAMDVADRMEGVSIEIAFGHSLGGAVLGVLHDRLSVGRFVYVDPAWDLPVEGREDDPDHFAQMASATDADLMASYPLWPQEEREVELQAVRRWDPDTARGVLRHGRVFAIPRSVERPSLVITAQNSVLVPVEQQRKLAEAGFVVRCAGTPDHAPHRVDPRRFLSLVSDWIL